MNDIIAVPSLVLKVAYGGARLSSKCTNAERLVVEEAAAMVEDAVEASKVEVTTTDAALLLLISFTGCPSRGHFPASCKAIRAISLTAMWVV